MQLCGHKLDRTCCALDIHKIGGNWLQIVFDCWNKIICLLVQDGLAGVEAIVSLGHGIILNRNLKSMQCIVQMVEQQTDNDREGTWNLKRCWSDI